MSNPDPLVEEMDALVNYIHDYVEKKLTEILVTEWDTGFRWRTHPDKVGVLVALKDLSTDHGIDFDSLWDKVDAKHELDIATVSREGGSS